MQFCSQYWFNVKYAETPQNSNYKHPKLMFIDTKYILFRGTHVTWQLCHAWLCCKEVNMLRERGISFCGISFATGQATQLL